MDEIRPLANLLRVYCAGPLFNEAERREMTRIAEALHSAGFKTFLPHADALEFANVLPVLVGWGHSPEAAGHLLHRAIFALDAYQVTCGCGSLVLNYNGRVPDEGAVAEMTMAWMLGKPVVIFKDDVRSLITGRDNPLVVGQTDFEIISELDQIPAALEAKLSRARSDSHRAVPCPAGLREPLALGARLWERLEALGTGRPDTAVAKIIVDLLSGDAAEPKFTVSMPMRPPKSALSRP